MENIVQGIAKFRGDIFPGQRQLYEKLVREGLQPKALVIACADSRVSPEFITQASPGDLFVTRDTGNIVPPNARLDLFVSLADPSDHTPVAQAASARAAAPEIASTVPMAAE